MAKKKFKLFKLLFKVIVCPLVVAGTIWFVSGKLDIPYIEKNLPQKVRDINFPKLDVNFDFLNSVKEKAVEWIDNLKSKIPSGNSKTEPATKTTQTTQTDSLHIATFNIRILSNQNRDDTELNKITDLLKKYDLIAVQEVRDVDVLKRIVKILKTKGYDFDFTASEKVGNKVKEIYAYFYRKDKVELIKKAYLFEDKDDWFIREPYIASFKSGNFDFTLITIHLLYGKNEAERREELKRLDEVYTQIQNKDSKENDVIMLGDFNFDATDIGWAGLKAIDSMKYIIPPSLKTMISDSYAYDNFWFQAMHTKEYTGKYGVERFDQTMFSNNKYQAKKEVSDHRPVWAEFDTSTDDD